MPAQEHQEQTDHYSHSHNMEEGNDFFEGTVLFCYSREEALRDGVLIDVSEMAQEAGFRLPTAVTASLWTDIHAIPEGSGQDSKGRLWDVLFMGCFAVLQAKQQGGADESQLLYNLLLSVAGQEENAKALYTVKLVIGPGDDYQPVLTLMRPEED